MDLAHKLLGPTLVKFSKFIAKKEIFEKFEEFKKKLCSALIDL